MTKNLVRTRKGSDTVKHAISAFGVDERRTVFQNVTARRILKRKLYLKRVTFLSPFCFRSVQNVQLTYLSGIDLLLQNLNIDYSSYLNINNKRLKSLRVIEMKVESVKLPFLLQTLKTFTVMRIL
jgi:hypothetical protein